MSLNQLSISQLAELSRLDRATVKKKLVNLKPVRIEAKRTIYDAHDALKILFGDDKAQKVDIGKQMAEEQLRYEKARADKMLLDIEKMKGETIPIAEVAATVAAEYSNVRARIVGIGARCAQDLAPETTPALVKERIDQEVNEALEELIADSTYEKKNDDVEQSSTIVDADSSEDSKAKAKA